MKQIMIDTNIFDKLIADPYFPDIWNALEDQRITFITTPIQEEEINQIVEDRKRQLRQSIPRKVVPCPGVSEIHQDDKHKNDRLIVEAAIESADALITEDQTLIEWCIVHRPDLTIITYQQFLIWFLQLEQPHPQKYRE